MHVATAPPCGGSSYVQFLYQRHSSVPSSIKPLPSMLGLEVTGGTDSLHSLESSSSSTAELLFISRRRAQVSQLWHGDFLRHQRGNDAHSLLIIEGKKTKNLGQLCEYATRVDAIQFEYLEYHMFCPKQKSKWPKQRNSPFLFLFYLPMCLYVRVNGECSFISQLPRHE